MARLSKKVYKISAIILELLILVCYILCFFKIAYVGTTEPSSGVTNDTLMAVVFLIIITLRDKTSKKD
jgi:F0F1-type ATP synthase assembly protein I